MFNIHTSLPENWTIEKIGTLCEINRENITREYSYKNIEYIDIASVNNGFIDSTKYLELSNAPSRAKRIVKDKDILISTVRPNLKHYTLVENALPNHIASTGFAVISATQIDPYYLYYYLTTENYTKYLTAIAESHTSAYPSFNPKIIQNSEIPYPPMEEQSKIGSILRSLDKKIEINSHLNLVLEKLGEVLFRRWFVKFEFPDEEGKPYLSSGGSMKQTSIGSTTENWEILPLDNLANFLNGLALQNYPPEGKDYLPVIKIRELRKGITESTDKASPKIPVDYIVENGDILFSWSGSLLVKFWTQGKGALNQHLFKIVTKYPKWLVYNWIKYHLPEFQRIATDKATTMGHIKRIHLTKATTIIPPKDVLVNMDKMMNPIYDIIINNGLESNNLSELRDVLLPLLMSGEIRVNV